MLEITDIVAGYGRLMVLHSLNLKVQRGQIVALLGGNGAGKTTTMKAVTGLVGISTGRVELEGRRIDKDAPHHIHALGLALVPQGRELFARMTVQDNLELGAGTRVKGAAKRARLEDMFEHFPRLRERRDQLVGTMSGGEQQMVAIARALMSRPRLLLLDEPSVGLSPVVIAEMVRIIQRLNQAGETILLVEQNIRVALQVAKYVYVMRQGAIVLEGSAEKFSDDDAVFRSYIG
jgi:branched-chain amino acid transport system ATP-binding protein